MITFGSLQLVHGDLSPFNVLVRGMDGAEPELVIIDVPQVLDLVSNPNGVDFLQRDCRNHGRLVRPQGPAGRRRRAAGRGAGCRLVSRWSSLSSRLGD